jgi:hypothetical protein
MDSDSMTSEEDTGEFTTPTQCRNRFPANYHTLSVRKQRRQRNNKVRQHKKARIKIFADNTNYAPDDGDVYEESANLGAERQLAEWEGHMADEIPVDPIPFCDPNEEEGNCPFGIHDVVQGILTKTHIGIIVR